ncbi:hypothetical protein [Nocardioides nanhaiensis]|uniref:Uncharacterized protein n=1 Tax=Nocardioides nanhaiensis TaxID=1476871 RepID=A0ABP8W049_9ACTN
MSTGVGIEELRAAERASERQRALEHRLRAAEAHGRTCASAVREAEAALGAEQADVEKLESLSMGRVIAALAGRRKSDLARERAEAQAAELVVAEARERLRVAEGQVDEVRAELAGLGDVAEQERAARELRERALRAVPGEAGERLTQVARASGELEARLREYEEALEAARVAHGALAAAADRLGRASDWAGWDTFGGGGLLTDALKYQRIDEATARLRDADRALVHLARELSDVEVGPVQRLEVPELTRAMDVWFDNIVSDWGVRSRVRDALARVQGLLGQVNRLGDDLARSRNGVTEQLARAEEERLRLLEF